MKHLIIFVALAALSVSAQATTVSLNAETTPQVVTLPALVAGPIDNQWVEILSVGASTKNQAAGQLVVEAYVEVLSNVRSSAVCRIMPRSFLGRPIDPVQVPLEFVASSPSNQGSNPQQIVSQTGVTRIQSLKITKSPGAMMYRLACRRQISNEPANIHAHLKVEFVGND